MPGGDGSGPWGAGPMSGRAAGYCAGFGVPGYMNPVMGRGGRGRGFGGGGGFGHRHWYYATGLPRWARWGGGVPPAQAAPWVPAPDQELDALERQAEGLASTLEAIRRRIEALKSEAPGKE